MAFVEPELAIIQSSDKPSATLDQNHSCRNVPLMFQDKGKRGVGQAGRNSR